MKKLVESENENDGVRHFWLCLRWSTKEYLMERFNGQLWDSDLYSKRDGRLKGDVETSEHASEVMEIGTWVSKDNGEGTENIWHWTPTSNKYYNEQTGQAKAESSRRPRMYTISKDKRIWQFWSKLSMYIILFPSESKGEGYSGESIRDGVKQVSISVLLPTFTATVGK